MNRTHAGVCAGGTFEENRIIRYVIAKQRRGRNPVAVGVLYFVRASIANTPAACPALEVASSRKLAENYSPPLSTQDNPLAFAFKAWPIARGAGIPEDVGFRSLRARCALRRRIQIRSSRVSLSRARSILPIYLSVSVHPLSAATYRKSPQRARPPTIDRRSPWTRRGIVHFVSHFHMRDMT